MARLSLAKFEGHLYAAADILRSKLGALEYKDLITDDLFTNRVFTAAKLELA